MQQEANKEIIDAIKADVSVVSIRAKGFHTVLRAFYYLVALCPFLIGISVLFLDLFAGRFPVYVDILGLCFLTVGGWFPFCSLIDWSKKMLVAGGITREWEIRVDAASENEFDELYAYTNFQKKDSRQYVLALIHAFLYGSDDAKSEIVVESFRLKAKTPSSGTLHVVVTTY